MFEQLQSVDSEAMRSQLEVSSSFSKGFRTNPGCSSSIAQMTCIVCALMCIVAVGAHVQCLSHKRM